MDIEGEEELVSEIHGKPEEEAIVPPQFSMGGVGRTGGVCGIYSRIGSIVAFETSTPVVPHDMPARMSPSLPFVTPVSTFHLLSHTSWALTSPTNSTAIWAPPSLTSSILQTPPDRP